jgi:hypothetical protein
MFIPDPATRIQIFVHSGPGTRGKKSTKKHQIPDPDLKHWYRGKSSGGGRYSERWWVCCMHPPPPPQQAVPKTPSSLNVCEKVATFSLLVPPSL